MDNLIAVALVTGACSVIGQYFISRATANVHNAVTVQRLGEIEKKMDKHNDFMTRVAVLEQCTDTVTKDVEDIRDHCKERKKECVSIGCRPDMRVAPR